jgi:hypothetical protein
MSWRTAVKNHDARAWFLATEGGREPIVYMNTVSLLSQRASEDGSWTPDAINFASTIFKGAKLTEDQLILIRRQSRKMSTHEFPEKIFEGVILTFAAANEAMREDEDVRDWVFVIFS